MTKFICKLSANGKVPEYEVEGETMDKAVVAFAYEKRLSVHEMVYCRREEAVHEWYPTRVQTALISVKTGMDLPAKSVDEIEGRVGAAIGLHKATSAAPEDLN